MSTLATGVFKKLTAKKQTVKGTLATGGAGTGQSLRRVTSTIDVEKQNYKSAEIRPSMQRNDSRHGVKTVSGQIAGELSLGSYQGFIESVLRAPSAAVVTTGALTNVTSAVTTAPAGTLTRAAGSFITDGFVIGDFVTVSGFTAPATATNQTYIISTLSALVMTVYPVNGTALVAKASGDSVTIAHVGKKCSIPQSGHTKDYWTIEHWFSDITESERFQDCVITGFNLKMGATGMVGITFPVMGLDMTTAQAAYFSSPTAASTTGIVASANGVLFISGVKVGVVTQFDLTVNGNYSTPGGVVGSNTEPDIFPGSIDVSGTASVLFDSATYRDMFLNETVAQMAIGLTTSNVANPGMVGFNLPALKFNSATKDDGEKGLTLTMSLVSLENAAGAAGTLISSISVQDTAFV